MGLFGNRNKERNEDRINLREYSGMRMEVMTEKEQMLFIATASITWEEEMELHPITTVYLDPAIPRYTVLLRGYNEALKKAAHLKCHISAQPGGTWAVSDVESLGKNNDREYYRHNISVEGEFMQLRQNGFGMTPYQMVNLSVGGTRIATGKALMVGEKIMLRSPTLEKWGLASLMCEVKRIFRKGGGYEYGCEFVDLTPQAEEQISKVLVKLQQVRMHED